MRRTKIKCIEDFLKWESLLCDSQIDAFRTVSRPVKICGKVVPSDLSEISLEQLFRLFEIKTTRDVIYVGAEVILNLSAKQVQRADTLSLIGFANWLSDELQRASALWSSVPTSHTAEEIRAGVSSLNFGIFGVVDWYARRMHMQNHDDALRTQWMRVFQCMKNDAEEAEYKKRLARIQMHKN